MRQPAFLRPALLALLFAASAACAACWMKPHNQTDAQHPLECRMEEAHPQLAGGPVAIRFQLTNRADHPVWLLRWNGKNAKRQFIGGAGKATLGVLAGMRLQRQWQTQSITVSLYVGTG